ncbi:MAG: hypothetical protein QOG86_2036, partial [Thermoleophilaceae bacterium]|nr:hypothetical protein [Thermoleophilaceae bacterium]
MPATVAPIERDREAARALVVDLAG